MNLTIGRRESVATSLKPLNPALRPTSVLTCYRFRKPENDVCAKSTVLLTISPSSQSMNTRPLGPLWGSRCPKRQNRNFRYLLFIFEGQLFGLSNFYQPVSFILFPFRE